MSKHVIPCANYERMPLELELQGNNFPHCERTSDDLRRPMSRNGPTRRRRQHVTFCQATDKRRFRRVTFSHFLPQRQRISCVEPMLTFHTLWCICCVDKMWRMWHRKSYFARQVMKCTECKVDLVNFTHKCQKNGQGFRNSRVENCNFPTH